MTPVTPVTAGAGARRARSSGQPLRWLLVAEAVSLTGTRVSFVAVPWLVLETTGSAARMGIVAFAEMLPYVAACALGGPVADQRGPRRVSVVCDLSSAATVAIVPLLATTDHLPFGALVAVMVLAGAGRGLGDTAKRPLLPAAAEASGADLTRAAAQRDGIFRLADLLGGPLAGLLVAWFGAAQVLMVDAASFGGAALVIGLGVRVAEARGPTTEAYGAALRAGIRFLRGDALIGALMLTVLVTNLFDQAYASVLLPVWAHDRVGSAAALGLIVGAFGAGAVLGNLVFTAVAPRLPRFWTFTLSFLLGGAPHILVLAATSSVAVVAAVGFTSGLATAAVNPILAAVSYERIPRHLQARVLGMIRAVSWAGIPVGGLVGGLAVDGLGLTTALVVAGGLYLVVTLVPLVAPVWRELDVVAPADDPGCPAPQAPSHQYAH